MTAGPKPGKENHRPWYIWDAWNRLAAVWMDDGDGTKEITGEDPDDILMAEYRYDALHRRIAKLVPNGENWDRTDYYYAGARVVEERFASAQANKDTPASSAKFQYVWDIRYVHAAVLRDEDTDSDGDCTDEGSERLYYTQDANFNVTALIATDGTPAERYVYDPYGKRTILDGTWTEITWANSKKNEILFTGHRLDNESGLYYGGSRYYHPTLGLWPSRDRRYSDGFNLYEYVRSSPADLFDPLGLAAHGGQGLSKEEQLKQAVRARIAALAPAGYDYVRIFGVDTFVQRLTARLEKVTIREGEMSGGKSAESSGDIELNWVDRRKSAG